VHLGLLGRELEAPHDEVLSLGAPGHAAVGQHAGRREHNALQRGASRGRACGVEVVGMEEREAAEQSAFCDAGAVGVAANDAQRA
jgi:hypothetical protein